MRNWWRVLYSIYAIIVLFVLFACAIPFYIVIKIFVPYPRQQFWIYRINRIMFLVWSAFAFFRYKIDGVENIDKSQTYISICNHTNMADLMASAYGIQVAAKPLVKKELLKIPIVGQLFAMASVPVDRKDENARKKSMDNMIYELNQNVSLILFVEGTRNRTGQPLKEFHNGAFALSMKTGVPILPVVFTNMKNFSKAESIYIRPWKIEVTHLAPIFPSSFQDVQEYKEYTYRLMWNYLVDNDESYSSFAKL